MMYTPHYQDSAKYQTHASTSDAKTAPNLIPSNHVKCLNCGDYIHVNLIKNHINCSRRISEPSRVSQNAPDVSQSLITVVPPLFKYNRPKRVVPFSFLVTDIDCYEIMLPMKPLDVSSFQGGVKVCPALDQFETIEEETIKETKSQIDRMGRDRIEEIPIASRSIEEESAIKQNNAVAAMRIRKKPNKNREASTLASLFSCAMPVNKDEATELDYESIKGAQNAEPKSQTVKGSKNARKVATSTTLTSPFQFCTSSKHHIDREVGGNIPILQEGENNRGDEGVCRCCRRKMPRQDDEQEHEQVSTRKTRNNYAIQKKKIFYEAWLDIKDCLKSIPKTSFEEAYKRHRYVDLNTFKDIAVRQYF